MLDQERWSLAQSIAQRPAYIKKNYVKNPSLSLTYIRYRIIRPILKVYRQLLLMKYPKHTPWLSPAAVEILASLLNKDLKGFEFGSGRSTVFISERIGHLISVEHNHSWYEEVKRLIESLNIHNVEYIFQAPENVQESREEVTRRYRKPYDQENDNYRSYYSIAENFADHQFDLVVIDGRARVECTVRSMDKLKRGGILVLDNSERKRYQPIHEWLKTWKKVNTTTGLTDTTFWFKPSSTPE